MNELTQFLQSQRLLVLATQDDTPWVTNVFYGLGKDVKFYFISGTDTEHSKHVAANPNVAFSTAWYNKNDHTDRKAIQGKGTCRLAITDEEIIEGVTLYWDDELYGSNGTREFSF